MLADLLQIFREGFNTNKLNLQQVQTNVHLASTYLKRPFQNGGRPLLSWIFIFHTITAERLAVPNYNLIYTPILQQF